MPTGRSDVRQRLRAALPVAMKARDQPAVSGLRAALAAIGNAEAVDVPGTDSPGAIEASAVGVGAAEVPRRLLTEDDVVGILRAEVAGRRSAAAGYEQTAPERAARLRAEADAIQEHLGMGERT